MAAQLKPYTIRVMKRNESITVDNVEDFISSYKYFYIKKFDGTVYSFDKNDISDVWRKTDSTDYKRVLLRKKNIHGVKNKHEQSEKVSTRD